MKNRVSRIIDQEQDRRKEQYIENMMKMGLVICVLGMVLCYAVMYYLVKL